jgi:hypothetical protein
MGVVREFSKLKILTKVLVRAEGHGRVALFIDRITHSNYSFGHEYPK